MTDFTEAELKSLATALALAPMGFSLEVADNAEQANLN